MEFLEFRNLRATCADDAAFEMMLTWQNRNVLKKANGYKTSGRNNTHPVLHFNLAWAEDQSPSYDEMVSIADEALAILGLSEHQAMFVSHTDEDHPHLHVMVSTVHPYSGKTANLAFSWKKFSRFAQQLETADGKIYCEQRVENNAARDRAAAERAIDPDRAYVPVKDRSPSRKQWFEQKRLAGHLRNLDGSLSYADAMKIAADALKTTRAAYRKKWADIYRTQRQEALHVGLIKPKASSGLPIDPDTVLDALTTNNSTFTRVDLAKYLHAATDTSEAYANALHDIETHANLISLGKGPDGRERLTTTTMQSIEQAMIGHARSLAGRSTFVLDPIALRRQLLNTNLTDEQAEACVHITAGRDLANVVGFAGTGKSMMLGVANNFWSGAGYRVQGAAFTGIAARSLEGGSGISSRTMHSLEAAWERNSDMLNTRTVVVIDEAGMVGSRQLERVLSKVSAAGAKAVLVGDPEQLQSIAAGAAFRGIEERTGSAAITRVMRQHEDWQRQATIELATQQTSKAMGRYEAAGMVHAHETKAQARLAVIDQWNGMRQTTPEETHFIFAHRRADVRALNKEARRQMRKSGDIERADHVIQSETGPMRVARGERLRFTRNDYDLGVMNGTLGTLSDVSRGQLKIRLDGKAGNTLTVDLTNYDHFDYGYAATVHKSQGVTVDHSHVLATPGLDRHATYVALSRQRETVNLHWAEEDFRTRDNMVAKISNERANDTTLDYGAPRAPEITALASQQARATFILEHHERLAASGRPLSDAVMVELTQSPDTLRQRVRAMHAHERNVLSQAQTNHAAHLAGEALYKHAPTPADGLDDEFAPRSNKEQTMPRNEKGEWVPDTHKAGTYTKENRQAAERTARDFDRAASGERARTTDTRPTPQVHSMKTITRAPTPFGTTHFGNTAHGQVREDQLRKLREAHDLEDFKSNQKDQRVVQLRKEFANQNSRSRDRSRGRLDRDNER